MRKYLQLEKQILLMYFSSKKIKSNQTKPSQLCTYSSRWVSHQYGPLHWLPKISWNAVVQGDNQLVAFSGGVVSLYYVLKDPGREGMVATPDFGVPVEDEVLREVSGVRNWALHLVHPRREQVPCVFPVL